jgi:hypothetical protein
MLGSRASAVQVQLRPSHEQRRLAAALVLNCGEVNGGVDTGLLDVGGDRLPLVVE